MPRLGDSLLVNRLVQAHGQKVWARWNLILGEVNRKDTSSENRSLIVSCSDGNLCLVQHQEGKYATTQSWHAHDYEPWIAAWNYTDASVLYSGNHEILAMTCGLTICSVRRRRSKAKGLGYSSRIWQSYLHKHPVWVRFMETTMLIFLFFYRFESGVTTIQSHPWVEHLFGVGRYLEFARCLSQLVNAHTPEVMMDLCDYTTQENLSQLSQRLIWRGVYGVLNGTRNKIAGEIFWRLACMQDSRYVDFPQAR